MNKGALTQVVGMPHEPSPKVSVILLNFNGYQDTRECLDSLRHVQYRNLDVIVVDNGSSDASCTRIQKEFSEITLLVSRENLGFAGGNNLGIEEALRRGAAYVLLLNNDTIVDPHFLTHLVQIGENDSRVGILGPKIFYASEPQRIWFAGGQVKYWSGRCGHLGQDQLEQDDRFSHIEDTGYITGCALFVKSTVFREVGLLDPKLFIYWEDWDFCMRVRKAGYRCVFVPMARVWHKVSRTCGEQSSFTLYLGTRNQLICVAKHIPFPHKPAALAFTFMRKLVKMSLLVLHNRDAASAVWAGILAFALRVYGPPRKEWVPGGQPSPRPVPR
jgi:GT2 family glycosyltransferase